MNRSILFARLYSILILIITLPTGCSASRIQLTDNPILLFKTAHSEYIVSKEINLHGKEYYMPDDCRLVFKKGGKIVNGSLVGNNTSIGGLSEKIFDRIQIKGTWIVPLIKATMFTTSDDNTLTNMSALSSEKIYNKIVIDRDCYTQIKAFDSHFVVKSKTDVEFKGNIIAKPCKYKGGYCIKLEGTNIRLNGNNHYLEGTLLTDKSNRGEWLHGIVISNTSKNIRISNIRFRYFWGDGISSAGSDVVIDNVDCRYNGRQGVSIVNGKNVLISNSSFVKIGAVSINEHGGPGAGIDIEPFGENTVDNIVIDHCQLNNNFRYRGGISNDIEVYQAFSGLVTIKNCQLGGLYIGKSNNVLVQDCSISEQIYGIDKMVSNIRVVRSGNVEINKSIRNKVSIKK